MYVYNYGTTGSLIDTPTSQGYSPSNQVYGTAPGYALNPTLALPPGFVAAAPPAPVPAPLPASVHAAVPSPVTSPVSTSPAPAAAPVQVPAGCHPIELVQFWRGEYKRGQPYPLHWALFVRTAPAPLPLAARRSALAPPTHTHAHSHGSYGNFYELVGAPDTYTAQFLGAVAFSPETLPDWRGTLRVGWVHPAALGAFERVARGVRVWRRRPEWRCQQWVWEVLCALGEEERAAGAGQSRGWAVEGWTFARLQRQMGLLLDAWEDGDI